MCVRSALSTEFTPRSTRSRQGRIDNIGDFKYEVKMARQQEMRFRTWGGARKGAGRPASGRRPSEKHQKRPVLQASQPVHVTLRIARDLSSLRTRDMYRAIRKATAAVAARESFRIVHLSIQSNHLHVLAEADDRLALAAGMQAFEISAAKRINAIASRGRERPRRGAVFPDRYHARILKSPTSVKRALCYVLNNWRRHDEDKSRLAVDWLVDPFSSGDRFVGWRELRGESWRWPPTYEPLCVVPAKSWLLNQGWQRAGTISVLDVPGPLD